MKQKIRLGIIGAGWMASMCCDALKLSSKIEAHGVYARSLQQASGFSKQYSIPFHTDDVDTLIHHPDIDAIYIATTNESHMYFAHLAANAGKSVLVEKPFALNHTQAKELCEAAKEHGCLVMEAMWSRFSPAMLYITSLVQTGAIGPLRRIQAQTGCVLTKEKNTRVFQKQLGGGALLDIGVYPLSIVQMIAPLLPVTVNNAIKLERHSGVDVEDAITLLYHNGLRAEVFVTCERELDATLEIEGARGKITCDNYVFAQGFTLESEGERKYYDFTTARDPYTYQLEHFARCLGEGRAESYLMPMDATLKVMRLLDDCRRAGGYWFPQEGNI